MGYEGSIKHLMIPELIDGYRVCSIGARAFERRPDLETVYLPSTVSVLKSFAFFDCKELRQIHLYDAVEDYYDGVLKQCPALEEIRIRCNRNHMALVKEILADNDRELTFELQFADGIARVTFPDYNYDFVEDTRARAIHHKIEGNGYVYRECVRKDGIQYLEYDRLFEKTATETLRTASMIAINRLKYPYHLGEAAKERYDAFLRKNISEVLNSVISERNMDGIRYLLNQNYITEEAIQEALKTASSLRESQICALLMAKQRDKTAKPKTFSL